MNRHTLVTATLLLGLMAAQTASAGLILSNGQEWEVRGRLGDWLEQSNQAALDTGWTWATEAEWLATGLDGQVLTDPAWSALMGEFDGQALQPNGWFADPLILNGLIGQVLVSTAGSTADATGGTLCCTVGLNADTLSYRIAYRAAQVAEPATLALSALALIAAGWSRRLVRK